ncbi:MAG: FkbM family methyltransferase [Rhodobacterales bacterium]|nr:FkbM family methyltransferase [Rhodobacterales bacterium]
MTSDTRSLPFLRRDIKYKQTTKNLNLGCSYQMIIISYAQNFEDVMLFRVLDEIKQGFYIDIGAIAPEAGNVTKLFYDRGWHGLNVEATPHWLEQLKVRRERDINLGVAVSDYEGTTPFQVRGDTGLLSMSNPIMDLQAAADLPASEPRVPVTTLQDLWRQHVPEAQEVHFLKIDVEGEETRVIGGGDWNSQRPWIVVVKAILPNSQLPSHEEWEPVLLGHRYRFVYWDGLNRFYLAEEHAALAASFTAPPNVFDGFVTYRQVLAEQQAQQDAQRADELSQQVDTLSDQCERLEDSRRDMARQLADSTARQEDLERQLRYFMRPFWERLVLRQSGQPVRALRRALFHTNGRPRGELRRWVLRPDGQPRRLFRDWMTSPEYRALPQALRVAQPLSSEAAGPNISPRTRYFLNQIEAAHPAGERG